MGIHHSESESPIHWRQFLALEEDLMLVAKYIEFSEENFTTYSIELASLLLGAGSEIDVVARQICKKKGDRFILENQGGSNAKAGKNNITEYATPHSAARP